VIASFDVPCLCWRKIWWKDQRVTVLVLHEPRSEMRRCTEEFERWDWKRDRDEL